MDECQEWSGERRPDGYGILRLGISSAMAHRAAWALHNHKPIPKGMCVCHTCDNPPCVNPNHLFLGTHQDNFRDMFDKGRHQINMVKGEATHSSKLKTEQVLEIRRRGATEKYKVLAAEYGVNVTTIGKIVRGEKWRHV